ncbi:ABC transporter ATP-binding protein [Corynebacterium pseudopelargi]|uniref:Nickel import ATP-binding protein NikE n=1 Tax=Corynebacterium pseudopelargi TaxID=2080757 RepID=A0A3G6IU89_9CORY|nr:ATP-binding cassette domain-containing protein [Corynebacterium pseudopelargi]AZA08188.1 Nickel import ATP-binding protein NikE [Corynebacterium pseudopelargi]
MQSLTPELRIEQVDVRAGDTLIVHNACLSLSVGQRVALLGRSGCGKTTLLHAVMGLIPLDSGEVEVRGGASKSLARMVQLIPQDAAGSLSPRLQVEALLARPLAKLKVPGDHRQRILQAMQQVDLSPSLLNRKAHELSGGQAQRVAIARALAIGAQFLLCDEPLTGLDPALKDDTVQMLSELNDIGILFVSHDLLAAQQLCQRAVVMESGHITDEGDWDHLLGPSGSPILEELLRATPQLHS